MQSTPISRRHFLRMTGAVTLGFSALRHLPALAQTPNPGGFAGYGPLLTDPKGMMDLPAGFSYRVLSRAGDKMSDGLIVPGAMDGMGALAGPNGKTILVRNHELTLGRVEKGAPSAFGAKNELLAPFKSQLYDAGTDLPQPGGTTTLIYDPQKGEIESQHLSLAGTVYNCAGGVTPWNSWVTCEEVHSVAGAGSVMAHGYNFEVRADSAGIQTPTPLKEMGRFRHEAIAVDAQSGAVYQTEDTGDGLIYRFWPRVAGQLAQGGRLEMLKIKNRPALDTRNWEAQTVKVGETLEIEWLPCEDVDSDKDDLRLRGFEAGAARFARGEGMWMGQNELYFACTSGGIARKGQIWRLDPNKNLLTLWVQPDDGHIIENADNLTVAPSGDVYLSEDLAGAEIAPWNYLTGISPRGEIFKFGRNTLNDSELAGCCFAPDGKTLFVNIYTPGITLAINGPFRVKSKYAFT